MAKKMKKTQGMTSSDQRPLVLQIAFWGLAALLFVTPFFRGLFFAEEQYKALVFAAVLFWLVFFGRWAQRNYRVFEHPLDYLMLGLPLVYIYSAFFAVNSGLAVTEIAKNSLYFLVFWVTVRLVRSESDAESLLKVIYYAAIAVALAGLATATGIINIKDGFLGGRFYSSFQYPNALASYLMAGLFLGLHFWNRSAASGARLQEWLPFGKLPEWLAKTNPWPYLFALGNFVILTVFVGAKSNGGFLVLLLVLPFFLFFSGKAASYFWHLGLTAVPAASVAFLFIRSAEGKNPEMAWLWFLLGLVVTLGTQALVDFWNRSLGQRFETQRKTLTAAVIGACWLVIAGAVAWIVSNEAIRNKVLDPTNAQFRIDSIGDALQMFLARPLTGWGGGGWQETYQAFQDYHFITRQAHGHYAQIGVETGVIGILLFVALWGMFLWTNHCMFHKAQNPARKALVLVVTAAGLAVGVHASIDFNLSLAALALALWMFFGITAALALMKEPATEAQPVKRKDSAYIPLNGTVLACASVAVFLVASFGTTLAVGSSLAQHGYAMLRNGNVDGGIKALQGASAYNPFEGGYHATLAQAYQAKDDLNNAVKEAKQAAAMSSYTPARYQLLANLYAAQGKTGEAVGYVDRAISVAPWDLKQYEYASRAHFSMGYTALSNGEKDKAWASLNRVLAVPDAMAQASSKLTDHDKKMWRGAGLEATPEMKLSLGAASYLLGQSGDAETYLNQAVEGLREDSVRGEAMLWLALVYEKMDDTKNAEVFVKRAKEIDPKLTEIYDALKGLPILG